MKNQGGSWGLGKWVFPDASGLDAYFGLTQRADVAQTLLTGMAARKVRKVGIRERRSYGLTRAAR